jgi:nicotinate phosphoribosyltransferase
MKFKPMVVSLLETDLYKFNMCQVMFHKHTNLVGEYVFKCRNANVRFTQEMADEISEQIDALCKLRFTDEELAYLRTIRFLKPDYIEFLRLWRPIRDYVSLKRNDDGTLDLRVKGPLFAAMQFEIYLLEIVNETYFRMAGDVQGSAMPHYETLVAEARDILNTKIEAFNSGKYTFKFAEFGCRRRLSSEWEDEVVRRLTSETHNCVGTSNVYLAMKYHLTPVGTYAHEFVQMYQGIEDIPLAMTNKFALAEWFEEYQGDNGTALTDTITTDCFLLDFNKLQATMYTGVRHDSGDPYEWGEKMIAHYESLGIDPKTKTLLFSDSLTCDKAQALYEYFSGRTKVAFGIGTHFSNDTGHEALNIVIKLQYVNGRPVAKLSDCLGKTMCQDDSYVAYLREAVARRVANAKAEKEARR